MSELPQFETMAHVVKRGLAEHYLAGEAQVHQHAAATIYLQEQYEAALANATPSPVADFYPYMQFYRTVTHSGLVRDLRTLKEEAGIQVGGPDGTRRIGTLHHVDENGNIVVFDPETGGQEIPKEVVTSSEIAIDGETIIEAVHRTPDVLPDGTVFEGIVEKPRPMIALMTYEPHYSLIGGPARKLRKGEGFYRNPDFPTSAVRSWDGAEQVAISSGRRSSLLARKSGSLLPEETPESEPHS